MTDYEALKARVEAAGGTLNHDGFHMFFWMPEWFDDILADEYVGVQIDCDPAGLGIVERALDSLAPCAECARLRGEMRDLLDYLEKAADNTAPPCSMMSWARNYISATINKLRGILALAAEPPKGTPSADFEGTKQEWREFHKAATGDEPPEPVCETCGGLGVVDLKSKSPMPLPKRRPCPACSKEADPK